MPLHLEPTRFWRFLNRRASKRPHRLHWQAIFRVAHQKSAKEQSRRCRRSWEASARSDAAKPLLPPGLGVTFIPLAVPRWALTSRCACVGGWYPQSIASKASLNFSMSHSCSLRIPADRMGASQVVSMQETGDAGRVGRTPHLLSRTLGRQRRAARHGYDTLFPTPHISHPGPAGLGKSSASAGAVADCSLHCTSAS